MSEKSALAVACKNGDIEMVKVVLGKASIKEVCDFAACQGTVSAVNRWNFSYSTSPVNVAARYGRSELVKWLLEQGLEAPYGSLFFAISSNKAEVDY
jgi:ankyrin repeat protein